MSVYKAWISRDECIYKAWISRDECIYKAWISRDECTKLQELSLLWNLNYIEEENEPRYTYFPSLHTAKIFSVDIDLGTVRTKLSRLF